MGNNKRLYRIWKGMRTRCNNPNFHAYEYYGGKGITIAGEWDNFITFESWALNNGYKGSLTIDRINGEGDYEPSNCRWITLSEQQLNKSNKVFLIIEGKKVSLKTASETFNIPIGTLRNRRYNGWSDEDIISPLKRNRKHSIFGKMMTINEMSETFNIVASTLRARYNRGVRDSDLLIRERGVKND